MFTGIIRAIGTVIAMEHGANVCKLQIDLAELRAHQPPINLGDSIAVNGACLTVSELRDGHATFAVSPETMDKCLVGEWTVGTRVNVETAPSPQTPLGGHLMAGHIDGIGKLCARHDSNSDTHRHSNSDSNSDTLNFAEMEWQTTRALGRLIAVKGAIAVDGVSLTVNAVSDENAHTNFTTMIVPHTLTQTTLGALTAGARVHLEADAVARYVQRLLDAGDKNVI